MGDQPDLEAFIERMQVELWHDLNEDIRSAINGVWSMAAGNRARRIVEAARLVGPSNVGVIPWPLVSGGVYEAVLTAGAVQFRLPDADEMQRTDLRMRKYGGIGKAAFAATVATIASERETAWIYGGAP